MKFIKLLNVRTKTPEIFSKTDVYVCREKNKEHLLCRGEVMTKCMTPFISPLFIHSFIRNFLHTYYVQNSAGNV